MAATTEILTVAEIVANSIPQGEFDTALIEKFILPSQRRYLRPYLGDDFYEEIQTQVETSTLTADNSTLLNDYLKPMMSYYVAYESAPQVRVNMTSAGVMINESETSIAASQGDFNQFRDWLFSQAQSWQRDATQFIKDEQDDDASKFPDFCDLSTEKGKHRFVSYATKPVTDKITDEDFKT